MILPFNFGNYALLLSLKFAAAYVQQGRFSVALVFSFSVIQVQKRHKFLLEKISLS